MIIGQQINYQHQLTGREYKSPNFLNAFPLAAAQSTIMKDKDLKKKLLMLGYSEQWLLYGIISTENLDRQIEIFNTSEDKHSEHCRYAALNSYLTEGNYLSDSEFNNYLELCINDEDQSMAGSAAINLFRFIKLTNNQFDELIKAISSFGSWTEKIIIRETFKRKLTKDTLSDALFIECMETSDTVIQEILLTKANVSQLLQLLEYGKTKRIRNIADEILKERNHY